MSLRSSVFEAILLTTVLSAAGGCRFRPAELDRWYEAASTPSHVEPRTPEEREALSRLPTLEPGPTVVTLGASTLSFEATYASAAQRVCRGFSVQAEPADGSPVRRVACREGDAWFLVPDLLEDGSSDGPEDAL